MAKKVVRLLAVLLLCTVIWFVWDSEQVNPIGEDAKAAMCSSEYVTVREEKEYWVFDGVGTDTALIFYPGAKVDERAYAPICHELAEAGVDVFLVKMPLHYAFFNMNADKKITDSTSYDEYAIAGHSLGGAMAVRRSLSNSALSHLFLLGAYVDKPLPEDLDVVVLLGSEDGVINQKKVQEQEQVLPKSAEVVVLAGGNHAGFGDYGNQAGDHEALLSKQEQWEQVVEVLLRHLLPA